jgi:hypothetical protein
VGVVGLDVGLDVGQRNSPVGLLQQWLRLDAAEHGGAAAFPAVGVRHLANDVLLAALAMAHQAAQIALRAGGHEQRRLLTQHRGDALLQRVDGRVVAEDVVSDFGGGHCRTHRRSGLGDGIAAEVDHAVTPI